MGAVQNADSNKPLRQTRTTLASCAKFPHLACGAPSSTTTYASYDHLGANLLFCSRLTLMSAANDLKGLKWFKKAVEVSRGLLALTVFREAGWRREAEKVVTNDQSSCHADNRTTSEPSSWSLSRRTASESGAEPTLGSGRVNQLPQHEPPLLLRPI